MTDDEKTGLARHLALAKVAKEIAPPVEKAPVEAQEEIKKRAVKYLRAMKEKGISP